MTDGPDAVDAPAPVVTARQLIRSRGTAPLLLASLFGVMATMTQITALGKQLYDISHRDLSLIHI